ncbi:hypothetical protein ACHAWF_005121 [Thalassiosira exigua]
MMNVRKPKARAIWSQGFTIDTAETTIDHSPENPFLTITPGSNSSAFEPVPPSPPKIQRNVHVDGPAALASITGNRSSDQKTFSTPERTGVTDGKEIFESPCDTTQATSLHSHVSQLAHEKPNIGNAVWGKRTAFKNQFRQITMNLPTKAMKSVKRRSSTNKPVDLSQLSIATICIMPRHGAGIAAGRKPFERMRTSLLLHMIQENQNASWELRASEELEGAAPVEKLNILLRNIIADRETCFAEKSQEAVKMARGTLGELKLTNDSDLLAKTELGHRNLISVKFLSGMYRELINDEKASTSKDGLSLMLVAGAFYALGQFDEALSSYQKAGADLKTKVSTSSDYTIHCAKLFNNMGCVYFEMKKYEKAMQTFQRALQLFHNENDTDYATWSAAILDHAFIMNNMSYMLVKFKQFDDASDLVDASFELQHILPGTDNMTVATLSTMAFIYYRTREFKSSLDTYSACIQLQDKSPLHSESDQVEILKKMADMCKKTKNHEKRIYLLRCILVYQQCYLLDNDEEMWETNAALANALQGFADAGGTSI